MAEKDFKVKKGLIVADSATVGGDLAVTGAITGDSATITGDISTATVTASGTITANAFSGDGSGLTGVTSYVDSDFDSDFNAKSTSDLGEGTNLYYTTARFDSDFGDNSTSDLSEGTNKYYTSSRVDSDIGTKLADSSTDSDIRNKISVSGSLSYNASTGVLGVTTYSGFDSDLGTKTTDNLSEGSTNEYYTKARTDSDFDARFDSSFDERLGTKSTTNLSEGSNKYYTSGRVDSDIDTRLSGSNGISISSGAIKVDSDADIIVDTLTFDSATVNTSLTFNAIPHPTHAEGQLFYDSQHSVFNFQNDISGVNFEIGTNEYTRVYNNTGDTLTKGTPVYLSGINGSAPTVAKGDATNAAKYNVSGLVTEDVSNGNYGYVTISGVIRGIDTSSLTAGQRFFLSDNTVGGLETTAPTYPNYPMCIGYVVSSDSSDGVLSIESQSNTVPNFRILNHQHVGGNLTVDGNLSILGTSSTINVQNLTVDDQFFYLQSGDQVGTDHTFTGTLNDMTVKGYYEGVGTTNYYVRIDGTGAQDTFEWSKDNFSTTEATGITISAGTEISLDNGFSVSFAAQTGHDSGDVWNWSSTASTIDFGMISHWSDSSEYTHAGFFFDATDKKFKAFDQHDPEITTTVNTAHASYNPGTIVATFEGNLTGNVTGDVIGTASNADALSTARTIQISGDQAGSASFDGSGNINIAVSTQSNSVDLGTHTTGNYVNDVTAGSLIDVTHTPAEGSSPTINVDLSELTDGTADVVGSEDELVYLDNGSQKRKLVSEIKISQFNTTDQITLGTDTVGNYMSEVLVTKGLDVSHTPAEGSTSTISLDLSELTDGTADVVGSADELIYLDAGNQKRKQIDEIKIGQFNTTNQITLTTDTTGNYVQQGATSGNGISGSVNSEGGTFTVTSNATNANTASTIVYRDGSGNFSAGTITAALSGNASTASTLQTARTISGTSFNGSANITLSTSGITEGTNKYYTTTRFDSDLGDATTSDLSEGTNQYYTTARARSSISVTDAGGDGSLSYNSGTGVLTYTGPAASDTRTKISASGDLSYNSSTGVMSFSETYSSAAELLTAIKTVDGAASGLDADKLDGQHGSYYRINVYDASNTLLN